MGNIPAGAVSVGALGSSAKQGTGKIPSAKSQVWTGAKLYFAIRDLPEVIPLIVLLSGVMGLAGYTFGREYFTIANSQFPSKEMRKDMEKQISYGQEHIKPHILQYVAKWKRDEKLGMDIAVWPFSNRITRMSDEIPTHKRQVKGLPAEGPFPTEY
ncbi:hypothetical protein DUNSADRAFT_12750 [Dunaliella salina]|uniref:Uncharacterized protein n=1 Tax=Dunaliella salina TaxID=3046 RepID=A0ABQ7GAP2_DUNSA|nr:hypothetical protein DUNSADRAFT_12750 [Dunaliella salina]|eukprot:KAF5831670.1 hypothetical protein DUNSADRAFT_12750 [Dunaliella salina]